MEIGAIRLVLQACNDLPDDPDGWQSDTDLSQRTHLVVSVVRDCIESLNDQGFIRSARLTEGLNVQITAEGRLFLSQRRRFPEEAKGDQPKPSAIKVVPKGLRSYDEDDTDFFLELLPGPRRSDGLPESIHFWKIRIEETDPEKTFSVGVIFGPSGCGKSSLVKAGLLPRLSKSVIAVYVEATAGETEARLLRGLRKHFPDLPPDLDLQKSLIAVRERTSGEAKKLLLVIDQFEQWLHANWDERGTELISALSECDGGRVQAIVTVRDDFSTALYRFLEIIGVKIDQNRNYAFVDKFDQQHARSVLAAFGRGYGVLPDDPDMLTKYQNEFLVQAIEGLSQEGRIVSVRLSLFAEMVKGRPWTPDTLKQIGGAAGVGVTFLEESFSARSAPPPHRIHEKAAQAVLKTLLPEIGSDIRGHMRSQRELLEASGYRSRPNDFDDLLGILDSELRLITPTEPEEQSDKDQGNPAKSNERYYHLTHDFLVPSIREWLTRKQKETRRGRAELLLADRSSLWNAKPENRLLPSVWEWANICLLTRRRDWTDPQRRMMYRAGRVHGVRTLGVAVVIALLTWGGIEVYGRIRASDIVDSLKTASTTDIPVLVPQLEGYRHWANRRLKTIVQSVDDDNRVKLHASLALIPVDSDQLPFLEKQLLNAKPAELLVIREFLKPHRSSLIPKLWSVLESAQPGDLRLLPAASALADYDPISQRWESVADKVMQSLIKVDPVFLGPWLDALRPMRAPITGSLAAVFQDVANLLMDADPKAYVAYFPIAQYHGPLTEPLLHAEMARKLIPTWVDPPLDSSWTKPGSTLIGRIELAQGMLDERFAFCQTLPMEGFVNMVDQLRTSGYRPIRCRPYIDGKTMRVAAVWTRDGHPWRMAYNQSVDEILHTDEQNRKEGYLPVDVAGYLAAGGQEGKHPLCFAALWAQGIGSEDDARMVLASSTVELSKLQVQLGNAGLVPLAMHAWQEAGDKLRYSGVWHKTAKHAYSQIGLGKTFFRYGLSEPQLPGVATQASGSLIDLDLAAASMPINTKERASSNLGAAEVTLKLNPDHLGARLARAEAYLQLGANQKAMDDLDAVIKNSPQQTQAYQFRAIAHARLGHKDQAKADLEKYQRGTSSESLRLYLAVFVAAELGHGTDEALEKLETALNEQPQDPGLHYDAACAYSLAYQAAARKKQVNSKSLSDRAIHLLQMAIVNGYSDYRHIQEDADLDPLRQLSGFDDILRRGHLERSYGAVWTEDSGFEATPLFGLDPAAHLQQCQELEAKGYRIVALSVARISAEGLPTTASVWLRPMITEEMKDKLAERQARAAVALLRMGKSVEIMPFLRHSSDPRLRSFIINWLNPLGADPKLVLTELDRFDRNAKTTPAQAQQTMDAVLFHPETSKRRALILALGTYGMEGLSPVEREALIGKLLDIYRDDPDSGVHGATEWTLRQWKQQKKLQSTDTEFLKLKKHGEYGWFVNTQGQTFAVVQGPVEFDMGSPSTEPDRIALAEVSHRVRINRRYAIATTEVTVEQYRAFVRETPQEDHGNNDMYSPDLKGPMNNVSWYDATAYCNWLSQKENLPLCYEPNENRKYLAGMRIRVNALNLTGYRLPTEAEWEYACRSGADTSRYYGTSIDLLERYAQYGKMSLSRAIPCGRLLPNDLGLSDMLGNVGEWSQDRVLSYNSGRTIYNYSNPLSGESIDNGHARFIRGGGFNFPPGSVRSASRYGYFPSVRTGGVGFRLARTYP